MALMHWDRPQNWPHDTPEYIFLARAVDAVGKKLFPNVWTGQEPRSTAQNDRERLRAVQIEVARLASFDELGTGWRASEGGAIRRIPPDWWQTENLDSRFRHCMLSVAEPFRSISPQWFDKYQWLFVKRADLDTVLSGESEPQSEAADQNDRQSRLQHAIVSEIKTLWPNNNLPARAKDRDATIRKAFKERGEKEPGDTSIRDAIKSMKLPR